MKPDKLWETTLGELELSLSKANFNTWLKDTFIIELSDTEITIGVPSVFVKEWLSKKYVDILFDILKKHCPNLQKINFKVHANTRKSDAEKLIKPESDEQTLESGIKESEAGNKPIIKSTSLNPYYIFINFVVGNNNKLAHAASMAVSKKPGKVYNPLFIYGASGLGKTHLMQAIGNEIQALHPKKKILYVTCENFCNDFILAVRTGKMNDFKKVYRGIDALLIDDVQFLAGKVETQEEFFHTFNYLHQLNRQIVLSSDRPPKAISTLEDRLKSRFEWGVTADISQPDFETRKAILESKALEKNLALNPDVIDYIASNVQNSIRELEGALNRLQAFSEVEGKPIDLPLAQSVLGEIVRPSLRSITPEKIISAVCKFYSISEDDIANKRRNKEVVQPRQIAMYLLKAEMNYSYPKIATCLGKKDHTTIMHGCKKIEKEVQGSPILQGELSKIKESLYSF